MDKENMVIWDQVKKTDPNFTKAVEYGKRKFTAIDPTWQDKRCTEMWGPKGKGWGLRNLRWTRFDVTAMDRSDRSNPVPYQQTQVMLEADFFYPGGVIEQAADMPFRAGDDTIKKLITTVKSKALSGLGFSADVYMGKFDDEQYVAMVRTVGTNVSAFMDTALARIKDCKTLAALEASRGKTLAMRENGIIDDDAAERLFAAIAERAKELAN